MRLTIRLLLRKGRSKHRLRYQFIRISIRLFKKSIGSCTRNLMSHVRGTLTQYKLISLYIYICFIVYIKFSLNVRTVSFTSLYVGKLKEYYFISLFWYLSNIYIFSCAVPCTLPFPKFYLDVIYQFFFNLLAIQSELL